MLDNTSTVLGKVAVHYVGNSSQDQDLILSQDELYLEDDLLPLLLKQYFLHSFKDQSLYVFQHETDIALNEVMHHVNHIFENEDDFLLQSQALAKLLYDKSDHPKVKGGEFYIVQFKDCVIDDELCDAVGLFKSENKDSYLKIYHEKSNVAISSDAGVSINKLDKGCLIFNIEKEQGYKLMIIDNTNKGSEAQYWMNNFLNVKPREDKFYHTKNYLDMCNTFCEEYIDTVIDAPRNEVLKIKENAMNYFTSKEVFNKQEFEEEALQEPIIIEAFKDYKTTFFNNNEITSFDEFDISEKAVKKAQKVFKSILKLDKNFHIYLHGRHDLIERGYDEEKGMYFYKTYFLKEE